MRQAIQYFIKYHISADVLLGLLGLIGAISMINASRSQFPIIESRQIVIETAYIGASPKEVEKGVTLKIENELEGIEGIKKIASNSMENISVVNVILRSSASIDKVLPDVKNAVDRINSFPKDAETSVIYKKERLDKAVEFMIAGDVGLPSLKAFAEQLEQDLLSTDAISVVVLKGYPDQEIEIALREDALNTYGLTFDDVSRAVAVANLDLTAGTLEMDNTKITLRAQNKEYYAENLADVIVATSPTGTHIYLKDVADLNDQWAEDSERAYYNGKPGVFFTVHTRTSEDLFLATETAKELMQKFNEENESKGVKASLLTDGSFLVRQRIDVLAKNGVMGVLLVLLILGLFLKPRIAFWVALSIPISMGGMFIIAPYFGVNINMLSLFGMILVIGILVDDGVVIAENIYQKHEEGQPPLQAAINGVMEVMPSVISAVLTTCWFFVLFFFVEGQMGDFMSNVAFVVIATLLFSLVEGFFILPAHIAHTKDLRKKGQPNIVERTTTAIFDFLKYRTYQPVLNFTMNNKMLTTAICVVMLFFSINFVKGGYVTATFFPYIDVDEVVVTLNLPAGTTEDKTNEILTRIEAATWEVNEEFKSEREDGKDVIKAVYKSINSQSNDGSLFIVLLDAEDRGMPSFRISNAINDKVGLVPEAENLTYARQSFFGADIQIGFVGTNMSNLRKAKDELKAVLEANPALKDVSDNDKKGGKEIHITLTEKAKALGLNLQMVIAQVRQGYFGQEVQRLQRGDDEVKVWVRYNEAERKSIANLENMNIRMAGRTFPLKELANLEVTEGILNIAHVNGKTKLEVLAAQRDPNASLSDIFNDLKEVKVPKILSKYKDVDVVYEGQTENASETTASIQRTMPIILLLVFATVVLTFRSFKQAIIVFLLIPFAFIGVVFGHWLHASTISMLSVFGIIAVAGVVVNDSLVLVSTMNRLLKEGHDFKTAVTQASLSRFRPIVLTSITTIAGLMPLILETSMQAQFLIPMALSLSYGLAAATGVMLILLPAWLVAINGASRWAWWLWEGETISEEDAEPAIQEMGHDF
ncbi:MAG: efflux RND transporter permease subunit [Aureispira sp.]|nr:efflux RND transporter permease subunit [Aureispira sp.]